MSAWKLKFKAMLRERGIACRVPENSKQTWGLGIIGQDGRVTRWQNLAEIPMPVQQHVIYGGSQFKAAFEEFVEQIKERDQHPAQ